MRFRVWFRRDRRRTFLAVLAVVATGVASWFLWPRSHPPSPPRADNVSRNYRACLLFAPGDHSAQRIVDAAWRGLQLTASTGLVNAQRFPVPKADVTSALPHFNSAIIRRCGVIVVAGSALAPATEMAAEQAKDQEFVIIGASVRLPNVTSVPGTQPDVVSAKVNAVVLDRAGG